MVSVVESGCTVAYLLVSLLVGIRFHFPQRSHIYRNEQAPLEARRIDELRSNHRLWKKISFVPT